MYFLKRDHGPWNDDRQNAPSPHHFQHRPHTVKAQLECSGDLFDPVDRYSSSPFDSFGILTSDRLTEPPSAHTSLPRRAV